VFGLLTLGSTLRMQGAFHGGAIEQWRNVPGPAG
jgi:hypothetical protein